MSDQEWDEDDPVETDPAILEKIRTKLATLDSMDPPPTLEELYRWELSMDDEAHFWFNWYAKGLYDLSWRDLVTSEILDDMRDELHTTRSAIQAHLESRGLGGDDIQTHLDRMYDAAGVFGSGRGRRPADLQQAMVGPYPARHGRITWLPRPERAMERLVAPRVRLLRDMKPPPTYDELSQGLVDAEMARRYMVETYGGENVSMPEPVAAAPTANRIAIQEYMGQTWPAAAGGSQAPSDWYSSGAGAAQPFRSIYRELGGMIAPFAMQLPRW